MSWTNNNGVHTHNIRVPPGYLLTVTPNADGPNRHIFCDRAEVTIFPSAMQQVALLMCYKGDITVAAFAVWERFELISTSRHDEAMCI